MTYALQPQDQVALVAFIERKSRKVVWAALSAYFLFPILLIAIPYWRMSPFQRMLWMMRLQHHWLSMLMSTMMPIWLFPPIFVCVVWKNKRQRAKDFQENDELRQPRTIEITPENLHVVTAFNDSQMNWQALHEVGENETYIFLLTTASSGHAIPKSAFGSDEGAQNFYRTAATFWEREHPCELQPPLPEPVD